jgi:hypothetical protein
VLFKTITFDETADNVPTSFWGIAPPLGEVENDFGEGFPRAFSLIQLFEAMEGNVFFQVKARSLIGR